MKTLLRWMMHNLRSHDRCGSFSVGSYQGIGAHTFRPLGIWYWLGHLCGSLMESTDSVRDEERGAMDYLRPSPQDYTS